MKTFRIQIRAYGYCADFNLESEDEDKAFVKALLDTLTKNDIVWEQTRFYDKSKVWLTYEEVSNANTRSIPLQTEKGTRTGMGAAL